MKKENISKKATFSFELYRKDVQTRSAGVRHSGTRRMIESGTFLIYEVSDVSAGAGALRARQQQTMRRF